MLHLATGQARFAKRYGAYMDEHRRLRFSFFLQLFAVVMFTAAGLTRGFALGIDSLTLILLGAGAIAGVIAAWTFTQLRSK